MTQAAAVLRGWERYELRSLEPKESLAAGLASTFELHAMEAGRRLVMVREPSSPFLVSVEDARRYCNLPFDEGDDDMHPRQARSVAYAVLRGSDAEEAAQHGLAFEPFNDLIPPVEWLGLPVEEAVYRRDSVPPAALLWGSSDRWVALIGETADHRFDSVALFDCVAVTAQGAKVSDRPMTRKNFRDAFERNPWRMGLHL